MEQNDVMASEPMMVRPTTAYADVMTYLHGINISREDKLSVGRQLLFEAENEYLAKALSRLDYLASLPYDWDGYGASPVSAKVIEKMKAVVALSRDADWIGWTISPESNGALCLQSKQKMSSISVGTDEFSYYSCIDDREYGENYVPFSPENLLDTMRKIA